MAASRPSADRVALFSPGVTVAMAKTAGEASGVVQGLTGRQLVDAMPELASFGADIEVHEFRQVPRASLTIDDVVDLAAVIKKQAASGAVGAVVANGNRLGPALMTLQVKAYSCWEPCDSRRGE